MHAASPAVDKGMLAACAWMIKIPTQKNKCFPLEWLKCPQNCTFRWKVEQLWVLKVDNYFNWLRRSLQKHIFSKLFLSPHLRAWLACLADQTPIWSFRRFTYWDFLLIIYFFDNSIFICNVCTFEVGSDQIVTLLKRKKGFEIFVFWFLCAPLTLSLLEKHRWFVFLKL